MCRCGPGTPLYAQAAVIKAIKEGKTNVDLNAPTTPDMKCLPNFPECSKARMANRRHLSDNLTNEQVGINFSILCLAEEIAEFLVF